MLPCISTAILTSPIIISWEQSGRRLVFNFLALPERAAAIQGRADGPDGGQASAIAAVAVALGCSTSKVRATDVRRG